jgi:hypothetical protein
MTKMRTLAATLLVSVAMIPAAALAQQNSQGGTGVTILKPLHLPVIVTNSPNQAANVFLVNPKDVDPPAPTPVTFPLTFVLTQGANTNQYTVLAGQKLVIHAVSGGYQVGNAGLLNFDVSQTAAGTNSPSLSIYLTSFDLQSSVVIPVFNVVGVDTSYAAGTRLV